MLDHSHISGERSSYRPLLRFRYLFPLHVRSLMFGEEVSVAGNSFRRLLWTPISSWNLGPCQVLGGLGVSLVDDRSSCCCRCHRDHGLWQQRHGCRPPSIALLPLWVQPRLSFPGLREFLASPDPTSWSRPRLGPLGPDLGGGLGGARVRPQAGDHLGWKWLCWIGRVGHDLGSWVKWRGRAKIRVWEPCRLGGVLCPPAMMNGRMGAASRLSLFGSERWGGPGLTQLGEWVWIEG